MTTPALALASPQAAAMAVVELVAVLGMFFIGWRAQGHRVRARAAAGFRRCPRVPISTAPVGEVIRVVGRVRRLGAAIVSPVSGHQCVYVRVEVRMPMRRDPVIDSFGADTPFLVADDSGVAAVHPHGAEAIVTSTSIVRVDATTSPDDPARRFVEARLDHRFTVPLFIHEWIIECDATVAVLGTATREANLDASSVDGGYRDAHGQLHFAHSAESPLRLSDEPAALCS